MSERNNVLILLVVIVAIGFFAQAMQIFQGTDTTTVTVSLNNTGNLDTPVQSITYISQSRADIKSMLDTHIVSGYSDPRYFHDGNYFSFMAVAVINGSMVSTETEIPLELNINLIGVNTDGSDIRLSTLNGTPLAREIESVGVPSTDSAMIHYPFGTVAGEHSPIRVYWGTPNLIEPTASSTHGSEAVWDNNFVGVWHMNNDPTGIIYDSSGNGNDGTSGGSMTSGDLIAGQYYKGINFDGSNDFITIPDSASLDLTDDFTLQAYLKQPSASTSYRGFIRKTISSRTVPYQQYSLHVAPSNRITISTAQSGANNVHVSNTVVPSDTNALVTFVYPDAVYLDDTNIFSPTDYGAVDTNNDPLIIGANFPVADFESFAGDIYEVRISKNKRSSNYIATTYRNLYNPTSVGSNPFYKSIQFPTSTGEITPSKIIINTDDITTGTYGSYPIIPANTAQDFILNGTQNFNYTIDFTPTDLAVTTSSSVLYAGRAHTFNAVVKNHNTGIAMPTQPDKVKYRLVGSGNTSVSAKEFVGTSLTLPALQKGTYTLFTSVGWDNIPTWSNEISQSVVLTDAATPAQAVALSVVEALTETTTDTTSNEITEDILVGVPGRIADGWKSMFDDIVTFIKNIIHNVSAVFS